MGVHLSRIERAAGDLVFLECFNNGKRFLALVDSGAQINVVSDSVAADCYHTSVSGIDIMRVSGVGGQVSTILKWITLPLNFCNGSSVSVQAAVIPGKEDLFILGIPFLDALGARINFKTDIMDMLKGPVPLIRKRRKEPIRGSIVRFVQLESISMPTLTAEERAIILGILLDHNPLFSDDRIGMCRLVKHCIRLNTERAVVARPRPYSDEHRKAIKHQVEEMLQKGIVRATSSPFAAEIVMVRKKDGAWRFCVDYRLLNKVTIKDKYPLPRIPDLLRSIKDSKYFVTLDLRSGYWQIPMEDNSIALTAFRGGGALYEFLVMPFGLTNAPATFQRAMDDLLGDLRDKGVSVYLDDILVHAKTFSECRETLETVLNRLERAGLTINVEKCKFFPQKLLYLGHILQQGHILPDRERVMALHHIKPATTLVDMQRLLGLFGYYQTFIPHYAEITKPLTDALQGLTKPKAPIPWTSQMQNSVKQLLDALSTAVLAIPLDCDDFLLETDASNDAVGAVLSVRRSDTWLPIEFTSKKFTGPQLRWPVREKEAFAIIHALHKFDHFLRGRKFVVHTDHQSLKWLLDATVGKVARWASRIAEYDMEIYWKRGTDLQHVDFLSRYIDEDLPIADRMCMSVGINTPKLPTIGDVLLAQQSEVKPSGKGYSMRGSIVCYRNGVWVPPILRREIMAACHLMPPYYHCGVKKTRSTVLKAFNWPNLHEDITDYVRGCLACQRMRPGLERLQGLIKMHPLPRPFETVYVDYWEGTHWGKRRIVLTMIDQSTKWVEAEEVPSHSAEDLVATLLRVWICRFGVPKTLCSDNGLSFTSGSLQRLLGSLGTTHLQSTPYHPQGNAPIESFHRQLNQKLPLFERHDNNTSFPTVLSLILWSYRSTIHNTTGESPAYLLYGMDMSPPYEQDWRFARNPEEKDRQIFLNKMREEIQERATWKVLREQTLKNLKRLPKTVLEGDLVLLRLTELERQRHGHLEGVSLKLVPRWSLPCRVLKTYSNGNTFLVRNILTGRTREAHITDLRMISQPQDGTQEAIWTQEVAHAARYLDHRNYRRRCEEFWGELKSETKKRRQESRGGELKSLGGPKDPHQH